MSHDYEALAERFDLANKIALLQEVQSKVDYHALAVAELASWKRTGNIVPLLDKFIKNLDKSGEYVIKVGEQAVDFQDGPDAEAINHGFHFGSLSMSIVDFLRIPVIYLAAYLLKQEVPVNLNNNARWLYAAVLFGLTVAALAAPVTAPVIAFVSAGLGFATSTFLLAKLLYQNYHLQRDYKRLNREIDREEERLNALKDEAEYLEQHLVKAKDEAELIDLTMQTTLLEERYTEQKKLMGGLYRQKVLQEHKLRSVGLAPFMRRGISLGLASLSVAGLVLSLFFPPIGLGILAAVAVIGGGCFIGSLLAPALKTWGNWLRTKFGPKSGAVTVSKDEDDPEKAVKDIDAEHQVVHDDNEEGLVTSMDSTADVLVGLLDVEHLPPAAKDEPLREPRSVSHLFAPKPSLQATKPVAKQDDEVDDDEGESQHPN